MSGFLVRGQAAIYLTHTGKARIGALAAFAFGVVVLARTGPMSELFAEARVDQEFHFSAGAALLDARPPSTLWEVHQ